MRIDGTRFWIWFEDIKEILNGGNFLSARYSSLRALRDLRGLIVAIGGFL